MTGYDAYKIYLGFKLHFTSERYDLPTNDGRVRYNRESYNKRQDSHFFDRIARVYNTHELKGLFISHFVSDSQFNDLYSEEAKETFVGWKKRIQSMTYNFEKELDVLLERVLNACVHEIIFALSKKMYSSKKKKKKYKKEN